MNYSQSQQGMTLIISLILLLVIGIVAIGSSGDATLNQTIETNFRDSDIAFQAAEAALAEGETAIEDLHVGANELEFIFQLTGCNDSDCFTSNCDYGLCFRGTYTIGNQCERNELGTPIWEEDSLWVDPGRHIVANFSNPGLASNPKYVIEFLCYVALSEDSVWEVASGYAPDDWARFYRVTSFAEGSSASSRVMLQSTYMHILN